MKILKYSPIEIFIFNDIHFQKFIKTLIPTRSITNFYLPSLSRYKHIYELNIINLMELNIIDSFGKIDKNFQILNSEEYLFISGSYLIVKQFETTSEKNLKFLK